MSKRFVTLAVLLAAVFAITGVSMAATTWTIPGTQFKTIQAAINSSKVVNGDTLKLKAGNFVGATFKTAKQLTITGAGVDKTFILPTVGTASGPYLYTNPNFGSVGFRLGAGVYGDPTKNWGLTIQNICFKVDFPIYGEKATTVTILNNRMNKPAQGITNWGGNWWTVKYNKMVHLKSMYNSRNKYGAGGIGIFVGDRDFMKVQNNKVQQNTITGTLYVGTNVPTSAGDGSGLTLYADFRPGEDGSALMSKNQFLGNTVVLTSNKTKTQQVHGIGLQEAKVPQLTTHVVKNNTVKNNVFTDGTTTMKYKVLYYPSALKYLNDIQTALGSEFDVNDAQLDLEDDYNGFPSAPF